ncbi:acyl-CoA N-acyltransferase [Sanghuangporus baumii]|uniref:Acyl-CoA N-acyltransferase n=1 Tax=Sanghuangporus baumii TaxID=108892 RepID=A0A9Q5I0R3_SANBA|nr:acyl-CoA N-acyltransferase [Sanghuangporus baumii]
MKANQNLAIVGERVLLVPYRKEHVEKYHEWMLDPELRELTASDPLTLEGEYEMQRKWQEDEDKLAFIVLSREEARREGSNTLAKAVVRESIYNTSRMIGDVNLFFKGSASDADLEVECEIMIAAGTLERPHRRNGLATEALQLLLSFATSFHHHPPLPSSDNAFAHSHSLPISAAKLIARIGAKNSASQALFAKLGFVETRRVEVFDEVEMRLVDDDLPRRVREWPKGTVVELEGDVA